MSYEVHYSFLGHECCWRAFQAYSGLGRSTIDKGLQRLYNNVIDIENISRSRESKLEAEMEAGILVGAWHRLILKNAHLTFLKTHLFIYLAKQN